jgi:putative addiction module component (TIGR02574 family)
MIIEHFPALQSLSVSEKWHLAEELWEDLIPADDEQRDRAIRLVVERRMQEFRQNPASASSWESVKAKIESLRHA